MPASSTAQRYRVGEPKLMPSRTYARAIRQAAAAPVADIECGKLFECPITGSVEGAAPRQVGGPSLSQKAFRRGRRREPVGGRGVFPGAGEGTRGKNSILFP